MAYVWKLRFGIDSVELSRKWNENGLFLSPYSIKTPPSLQDRHKIRGHVIIETESGNQEEAMEKAREKIERFVACYSILTRTIHVRIHYIMPIELVNEEELRKLGKPIPTISIGSFALYAEAKLTPEELNLSYQMLTQIATDPKSKALGVSLRWYRCAMTYRDPYDSFFALWISFNSFYTLYYNGPAANDAAMMDYLAIKLFTDNEAKRMFALKQVAKVVSRLISLKGSLKSQSARTDYSEKLDLALKAKGFKGALKNAIRCVYCIRKTLFHGERDISEADKQLVQDVNPFLKELVRMIVLKYTGFQSES